MGSKSHYQVFSLVIHLVKYKITARTILVKKVQYVVELPSSFGMKTKTPFGVVTLQHVTWNLRSLRVIWGMYPECHKTISLPGTYLHVQHLATLWDFLFLCGLVAVVFQLLTFCYNIQCYLYQFSFHIC